jgi:hypothetical protein
VPGVLLAALACSPEEPPPGDAPPYATELVYESERVRVYVEPDKPFCQGDGAYMDAHIERVAAAIGIAPPEQVGVFVLGDERQDEIADWCSSSRATGCFAPHSGIVLTQVSSLTHELDHAVFEALNGDVHSRFWLEAVACAFEDGASKFGSYTDGLLEQSSYFAYEDGDHLLRFLQATYGTAALANFYVSIEPDWQREDIDAAFAEAFGVSYEQLIDQYERDAAYLYPGFGACADGEVVDVPIGETQLALSLDCDAADTHTFVGEAIDAMYVRRRLRVPELVDLRIEYSSPGKLVQLRPCYDEPIAQNEHDSRLYSDAWFSWRGDKPPTMGLLSHQDAVPAGTHEFSFAVARGEAVELELTIKATPTPEFEGVPPPNGEFLLALRIDETGLPLQFILTVINQAEPGSFAPRMTLQPLQLALGSITQPRDAISPTSSTTDVNHPYEWRGDELPLEVSYDDVTIPGAANPNDGTDIYLEGAHLFGSFRGPDALCGSLEGYTGAAESWGPDIGGSFAAIRLTDTTAVTLPHVFPSSCDELP